MNFRRDSRAWSGQFAPAFATLLALLFTASAVAVRLLLNPWLGDDLPFVTLFGAVAAAVWIGGQWQGILASAVGYLACNYLFIEPRGTIEAFDPPVLVGLLAYAVTCGVVIALSNATRRAQSALARSERELTDFFDRASIALHWIGADGIIIRANQAVLDLLGYARDEYVGRHMSRFHVDRDSVDATLAQLLRGDVLNRLPARIRCKDGSIKKVLIDYDSLWDGRKFVHGRGLMFDVTQQQREEETRGLLAAIVAASDDAIVSKTLEGVVLTWNEGAHRLFGYSAAEVVGQSINLIIPAELREEQRQILERIRHGERVDHFETVRVAKDGRRLDISLTISPIRDEAGRVIGASKVARDITERKQMDAAMRDSDRRKDEFLATLAHELRNPLAPIRHSLEILLRAEDDRRLFRHATDILGRQLSHMIRLVDDLLDVSRITRDKLQLRKTNVELGSIVRHAVEASRSLAERGEQTIEVSIPQPPIHLEADPVRLTQVFTNLLDNACQYTEPGGRIWLSVERHANEAAIIVRDSGIGMPADQVDGIFEMFAQVEEGPERPRRGLGIGLTLVRRLVQMHGGTVTARSEGRGLGSEFEVRLPAINVYPDMDEHPPAHSLDTPARRILVVDDNRDSADSIATLLQLSGHRTMTVHDGMEAVEATERFRPEVVLLDVGLPKISGIEACRRIRNLPSGRNVIIVALTGWGQDSDRRKTREAGFDAHLVKPVDYSELLQLIAALMPSP